MNDKNDKMKYLDHLGSNMPTINQTTELTLQHVFQPPCVILWSGVCGVISISATKVMMKQIY